MLGITVCFNWLILKDIMPTIILCAQHEKQKQNLSKKNFFKRKLILESHLIITRIKPNRSTKLTTEKIHPLESHLLTACCRLRVVEVQNLEL